MPDLHPLRQAAATISDTLSDAGQHVPSSPAYNYGWDAVFAPFASMWRRDLIGREAEYYNISQVLLPDSLHKYKMLHSRLHLLSMYAQASTMVPGFKPDSTSLQAISMLGQASSCSPLQGSLEADSNGNPFGFVPQAASTVSGGLPRSAGSTFVLWSTQMTRNRSRDQLDELQVCAVRCVSASHRSPQGLGVCQQGVWTWLPQLAKNRLVSVAYLLPGVGSGAWLCRLLMPGV